MRQHKQRKTTKSVKAHPTPSAKKASYRVRNWADHNQALKQRYDITIWVDDGICQAWQYTDPRQQGGQYTFSDVAIECMGTLREAYHLPLRGTEGFFAVVVQAHGGGLAGAQLQHVVAARPVGHHSLAEENAGAD